MTRQDDRNDLKDAVVGAQEHMRGAIELLRWYCEQTGDRHTEAYILDHLKIMTGNDHGFMSRDANLDDVLESLNEQDKEDDEQLAEDNAGYYSGIASGLRR